MEVAAKMFAERGFRAVTIDDMGTAVGITGPAIYRYFPSKEVVLATLLTNLSESLLATARARVAAAASPREILPKLIEDHVTFAVSKPWLIALQRGSLDDLTPSTRGRVRRLQRFYLDIWSDAVVSYCDEAVDPVVGRAAAITIFGLINSAQHLSKLQREAAIEILTRMAMACIEVLGLVDNIRTA